MQKLPDLKIDFEAEIDRYRDYAEKIRPLVVDSVSWLTSKLWVNNLRIIRTNSSFLRGYNK